MVFMGEGLTYGLYPGRDPDLQHHAFAAYSWHVTDKKLGGSSPSSAQRHSSLRHTVSSGVLTRD